MMLAKRVMPAVTNPRESSETFRHLIEGVQDVAIFMLDGAGRVSTWNSGAERIKGYRAEEIVGQHFSRFYPPEAVAEGKPARLLAIAARDGRVEDEGWRVRKDGARFWAEVIITARRDSEGAVIGFAKVTRDLTARKETQDALYRSEQTFQLLVESIQDCAIFMLDPDGRVASWNAAAERIKGYRAHEIMGEHFSTFYPPDDVAQGKPQWALEIAEREGRHEDEGWRVRKDGTRFLAVIRDSAKLGGQLIDGLLSFSRLGRQALARAPVDVTALAESVVAELRQTQGSVAVEVVLSPLPPASGDAALLRHVLVNLIGNAFKFSVKRAHPKVEIGAEQHGSDVAYYVKDNGVGFDMQYAGKLFGVFQRLHRPDEFEGTGVGLALAQHIIQRHGGRIWAEGKVNEGATFRFTLTGTV